VARLIGAPPGYVGYEEGGQLTELVRRRPYSVLLFDEIEKAHPDAFNIFLQILDDGRLTDGKGRTVDFKNTVIIMTSNIGSQTIHEAMNGIDHAIGVTAKKTSAVGEAGVLSEGLKREIQAQLLQHFRPEFLNRIDEVVIFNALGKAEIEKIIDLQLQNLQKILAERKIEIKLTKKARELLFEQGYDPQFGARPLKRAIQRLIQDPLAMKLLDGEIAPGESLTVDADPKRGEMIFTPATAKAART
jgi:ATP-dependent Clp protease ATP-binding subunit ClpB